MTTGMIACSFSPFISLQLWLTISRFVDAIEVRARVAARNADCLHNVTDIFESSINNHPSARG